MNKSKTQQSSAIRQVEQEHEELRILLGDIHKSLADESAVVAAVAEQLATLCEKLESHFRSEEEGGFFSQITEQAPRLADRATLLCAEHISMLRAAQSIAFKAARCIPSGKVSDDIPPAFHELSKQLMHHESEENDILQKAYWEDIGPAD